MPDGELDLDGLDELADEMGGETLDLGGLDELADEMGGEPVEPEISQPQVTVLPTTTIVGRSADQQDAGAPAYTAVGRRDGDPATFGGRTDLETYVDGRLSDRRTVSVPTRSAALEEYSDAMPSARAQAREGRREGRGWLEYLLDPRHQGDVARDVADTALSAGLGWLSGEGLDAPTVDSVATAIGSGEPEAAFPTSDRSALDATAPDVRPVARAVGTARATSVGFADELAGLVRGPEAEADLRATARSAEEQAPTDVLIGEAAGTAPLAALPAGASTRVGRVAQAGLEGLGYGLARGYGDADPEPGAEDATLQRTLGGLEQGALEGAAGALFGAAPEVAGVALERGVPAVRRRLDDAVAGGLRREARSRMRSVGLDRETERVRELMDDTSRVGPEDVRELLARPMSIPGREGGTSATRRIGETPLGQSRGQAYQDAPRVREALGRRVGEVAEEADALGVRVDLGRWIDGIGEVQQAILDTGLDNADAVVAGIQRIVDAQVRRMERAGSTVVPFSEAVELRRTFDAALRSYNGGRGFRLPSPELARGRADRLSIARRELASLLESTLEESSPELASAFRGANRDFEVFARLEDAGLGTEPASGLQRRVGEAITGGVIGTALGSEIAGEDHQGGGGGVGALLGGTIATQIRARGPAVRTGVITRAVLPMLRGARASLPWARDAVSLLESATRAGQPTRVAAVHVALMSRYPEYRELMRELEEEAEE